MIDFSRIDQYRENNRIEAKKALGGLPHSIWETYSAFANTLGGIILLGVEEHKDRSLHTIDLPDPERLVREFWDILNDPQRVSVNILSNKQVQIENVDGNRIIAITVPRAQRCDRPVYIGGNPFSGSYRRNGEGDYKCTHEEVQSMLRDAGVQSQDMKILQDMGLDVLDYESVHRYRIRMKHQRPGHVWEELEDSLFLYQLRAADRSVDGVMHPTAAGLLMFGAANEIVKEFPGYCLDYQEQMDENVPFTERIVSSSGDWSGNLFDFYSRVSERITEKVPISFRSPQDGGNDAAEVHKALREALANSLINADYYGRQGLVIIRRKDRITFSNPGAFRIGIEEAKSGGISDPRNAALIRMFNLVNISEGAGGGIPHIYSVWKEQGWELPVIEESFEPERTTLVLKVAPMEQEKTAIRIGGNEKSAIKSMRKQLIIEYLTVHASAGAAEIAAYMDVKLSRAREYLSELITEDIVVAEGSNQNRIYRLKA